MSVSQRTHRANLVDNKRFISQGGKNIVLQYAVPGQGLGMLRALLASLTLWVPYSLYARRLNEKQLE